MSIFEVEHVVEDSNSWEHFGLEKGESLDSSFIRVMDGHGSHHSSFKAVPESDWADVSAHHPAWNFGNFDVSQESAISWEFVHSGVGNTVPNMKNQLKRGTIFKKSVFEFSFTF